MRWIRDVAWGGALWIVALLALPAWPATSAAQERTMRFRPVPAESASSFDRITIRSDAYSVRGTRRGHTPPALDDLPAPPVPPEPSVPEPPEPPEPTVRTTSGDIVRFGSDITVKAGQLIQGDVVSFGGSVEVIGVPSLECTLPEA